MVGLIVVMLVPYARSVTLFMIFSVAREFVVVLRVILSRNRNWRLMLAVLMLFGMMRLFAVVASCTKSVERNGAVCLFTVCKAIVVFR